MRRKLYFAVATLLLASLSQADDNLANAGQIRRENSTQVANASQIAKQKAMVDSPAPVQSQSFFGRIMELERRKNAWLRKTFLGRE